MFIWVPVKLISSPIGGYLNCCQRPYYNRFESYQNNRDIAGFFTRSNVQFNLVTRTISCLLLGLCYFQFPIYTSADDFENWKICAHAVKKLISELKKHERGKS